MDERISHESSSRHRHDSSRPRSEKISIPIVSNADDFPTDYMSILTSKYMIFGILLGVVIFICYYLYKEISVVKQTLEKQTLTYDQNKLVLDQTDMKINKITSILKVLTGSNKSKKVKEEFEDDPNDEECVTNDEDDDIKVE